jgi:hypothetical protein
MVIFFCSIRSLFIFEMLSNDLSFMSNGPSEIMDNSPARKQVPSFFMIIYKVIRNTVGDSMVPISNLPS